MSAVCTHLDSIEVRSLPDEIPGCEDCLALGDSWVHLRRCVECGHVGCCDNSPGRHATAHFHAERHPLIQSFEPGEEWFFCYVDDLAFEVPGRPPSPSHP